MAKTKVSDLPAGALIPSNDDAYPVSIAADLMQGADAIASFTGLTARQVYRLAEQDAIPVFRMGSMLCARRSTWIAWIESQERAVLKKG